jgi:hypothetical protein
VQWEKKSTHKLLNPAGDKLLNSDPCHLNHHLKFFFSSALFVVLPSFYNKMLRTLSLRHVRKNAPFFMGNERMALSSPGRRLYQSTTTTTHRSLLTPSRVSLQTSLATKKVLAAFPTTTKRYFQSK